MSLRKDNEAIKYWKSLNPLNTAEEEPLEDIMDKLSVNQELI